MRGYYGIVVHEPKFHANVGTIWRTAHIYNAAFMATIGCKRKVQRTTDTMHAYKHKPILNFTDIDDCKCHLPENRQIVAVEMCDDAVSLQDFVHPERAIYLLGSEDASLSMEVLSKCDHKVVIETPTTSACPGSLNVAVAASIVMYDRNQKQVEKVTNKSHM